MKKLTVYSSTMCTKCKEAKTILDDNNIPYEEILLDNIKVQASLRLLLSSLHADNVTTLPVFYVNNNGLESIEIDVIAIVDLMK